MAPVSLKTAREFEGAGRELERHREALEKRYRPNQPRDFRAEATLAGLERQIARILVAVKDRKPKA